MAGGDSVFGKYNNELGFELIAKQLGVAKPSRTA